MQVTAPNMKFFGSFLSVEHAGKAWSQQLYFFLFTCVQFVSRFCNEFAILRMKSFSLQSSLE